eukprot:CAMPEP_0201700716 /NCGR_PEP_ID=MMETSP0578-20130828/29606_1 /ASSEMBLY_ACC=CAM_ASM_000663 /TAXON_ID=267565 /ORGANISM="Skeletonema grethea, Strain CCMP 1804" /LENGTH=33 /DNA_ID= /DNA_START= /DNA_END= /DNA_ORIENTATION=
MKNGVIIGSNNKLLLQQHAPKIIKPSSVYWRRG